MQMAANLCTLERRNASTQRQDLVNEGPHSSEPSLATIGRQRHLPTEVCEVEEEKHLPVAVTTVDGGLRNQLTDPFHRLTLCKSHRARLFLAFSRLLPLVPHRALRALVAHFPALSLV